MTDRDDIAAWEAASDLRTIADGEPEDTAERLRAIADTIEIRATALEQVRAECARMREESYQQEGTHRGEGWSTRADAKRSAADRIEHAIDLRDTTPAAGDRPATWPALGDGGDSAAVMLVASMAEVLGPEKAMAVSQRLARLTAEQWQSIADLGQQWTKAAMVGAPVPGTIPGTDDSGADS